MKKLLFLFSIILFVSSVKAENLPSFKHDKVFNCTEVVNLLQPKQYYYDTIKDPTLSNQLQFGFLAQDLLKIIPNTVMKDDKGYLVDYEQIIAINTGCIKELIHINMSLNEEITILKAHDDKVDDELLIVKIMAISSFLLCLVFYFLSLDFLNKGVKKLVESKKE